jgi:methionyl-tRNA formyltransferase
MTSINDLGIYAIEELVRQGQVPVALITVKDRANLYMDITDFTEVCRKHNIPLLKMSDINSKETVKMIADLKPDLGLCMGWNQVLHNAVLKIPPYGWMVSHPTRLPAKGAVIDPEVNCRGGNEPDQYTIICGFKKTALTLFWCARQVDVGDIFAQQDFDIDVEHETGYTIIDKIGKALQQIIREKFPLILQGKAPRIPQDPNIPNKQPYMPPIDPNSLVLDPNKPIKELYALIRANYYPYPNAFFMLGGQRVYVSAARVENGKWTELKVRVGGSQYEHDSYLSWNKAMAKSGK